MAETEYDLPDQEPVESDSIEASQTIEIIPEFSSDPIRALGEIGLGLEVMRNRVSSDDELSRAA